MNKADNNAKIYACNNPTNNSSMFMKRDMPTEIGEM
jgi:hypothetical protein